MENRWLNVLLDIRDKVSSQNFKTWIKPIKFHSYEDDKLTIVVPNKFFKNWIVDNFLFIIEDSVSDVFGSGCNVDFNLDESMYEEDDNEPEKKIIKEKKGNGGNGKTYNINGVLNQKYKFDTFVTGNSNEFSHAAALAVAENEISKYNPLFIYSDVGLGKTHLIQAICHKKLQINKNLKVCYYSSEHFTNELINSIRFEKMDEFRNKFRKMDLLMIDDIQFIAGKERTQEEFFHTFNSLYDAHKQIVITSDTMPRDIPKLEDRLRSRFEWGLIADIQHPDIETKVAILKKKSDIEGISLPNEVAFFIASINDKANVRELEGYLLRTTIFASLKKCNLTLDVAKEALKEFIAIKERIVTIESVQKIVSNYYNIKVTDLKSDKKLKQFVKPRHIAMYLSRSLTKSSFPEIGVKFGNRDHSTIIYAYKSVEKKMKKDPQVSQHIESIINLIKS
jgi:chromosomal replication initiator protein